MSKSFTRTSDEAMALAARVATEKTMARIKTAQAAAEAAQAAAQAAPPAEPAAPAEPAEKRVQFNVLLPAAARERIREYVLAARTTERELLTAFAMSLPDVAPRPAAPPLPWVVPTTK